MRCRYNPSVLVVQCGADTLSSDPMQSFNLTPQGMGHCLSLLLSWNLPTMLLGGGEDLSIVSHSLSNFLYWSILDSYPKVTREKCGRGECKSAQLWSEMIERYFVLALKGKLSPKSRCQIKFWHIYFRFVDFRCIFHFWLTLHFIHWVVHFIHCVVKR